jgi:hypothetical protein
MPRGGGDVGMPGQAHDADDQVLSVAMTCGPVPVRAGLGRGQAGDRIAGLGPPPAAAGAAGDLDGLGGVRERQPGSDRDPL